jgi:2-dehydropantoate 2-reductase
MQRDGLQVKGVFGSFVAPVRAATALDFRPDVAFLTVKTQDVLAAVQTNRQFLADTPVVTCQNGIRSAVLVATILPPMEIISAIVTLNASYLTHGTVTAAYSGSAVVGRPFGPRDAQVDTVAAMLGHITTTRVTDNIVGAHWLKLIVNLNNALPALTNLALHEVLANDYLRSLVVQMMREGLQVVQQAGIQLAGLPDAPALLIQLLGRLPTGLASGLLAIQARRLAGAEPLLVSTLQSVLRNQPTEIDYLNGEIVRAGAQWNVPTPLNATIVAMVHETEQSGQFWTVEAIRERLNGAVSVYQVI